MSVESTRTRAFARAVHRPTSTAGGATPTRRRRTHPPAHLVRGEACSCTERTRRAYDALRVRTARWLRSIQLYLAAGCFAGWPMEAGGAGRPAAGEVGEPSPFAAYRISSHVSRVTAFPVLAAAATRSLLTLHLLGVHDA